MDVFQAASVIHFALFVLYLLFSFSLFSSGRLDPIKLSVSLLFFYVSVWALGKTMMHNTRTTMETARIVLDLITPFNMMFFPGFLMFGLLFWIKPDDKKGFALLGAGTAVFAAIAVAAAINRVFIIGQSPFGWLALNNPSLGNAYNIFILLNCAVILLSLFLGLLKSGDIVKRQAILISAVLIAVISVYYFFKDNVFLNNSADILGLPVLVGFYFSMRVYGMFDFSHSEAARTVFENIGEYIALTGIDGRIERAGGLFAVKCACSRVAGQNIKQCFTDPSAVASVIKDCLEKGVIQSAEGVLYTDDALIPASITASLIRRLNFPIAIAWIITDTSEASKFEEGLKKYSAELEAEVKRRMADLLAANIQLEKQSLEKDALIGELNASEEKFRAAFMMNPDSVNISTLDGKSIDCNDGYARTSGYTREETIGNTASRMNIWKNPEDRQRLIAGLKENGFVKNLEAEFVKKDGSFFSGMMSAGLIKIGGKDHIIALTKDITERKRMERILAESENKFRMAFLTSPDAIMITRLKDEVFVEVNEGFTKVSGYTREEAINNNATKIGLWADPGWREKVTAEMVKNGSVNNLELDFKSKSGKVITTLFSSVVIDINNEKHSLAIVRDISDRKKIEKVLAESEQKFRLAFDTSPDAININRLSDGLYIDLNQGFTRLTGFTREDVAGKTSAEIKIWENMDDRAKLVQGMKENGFVDNLEAVFRRKDGSTTTALMSAKTMMINNEPHILSITRDISERKAIENAIKESEEKFRTLSEQSMVAILIIQDDVIKYLNKGLRALSGYSGEEILSWGPGEFAKMASPEYRQQVLDQAVKKQAARKDVINNYTVKFVVKDGSEKWVNIFSKTIMYGGKPADMVTLVDISDIKEAQEKLMVTVEELERSNNELEKFAYAASHDMQEPLRMVSNYVQLLKLKYKGKLDADADFYIDTAVKGAVHMSHLINGLLDLSKMGRVEKSFENVDMKQAAEEVKKILEEKIEKTKAKIIIGDLPAVKADRVQMVQLLQNLLANALKFVFKDRKPVVEISGFKSQDQYIFCIKDNGIGIAPKYFDRIFVVFQQLNTKDEYEGSGIGLAICKKIVEHHKGRIWVESEEGKGASFYFTIPV